MPQAMPHQIQAAVNQDLTNKSRAYPARAGLLNFEPPEAPASSPARSKTSHSKALQKAGSET